MLRQIVRVKEIAQKKGFTMDSLARKSDVRFGTLQAIWQKRVTDPSFSTVIALAKAMDLSTDAFIAYIDDDESSLFLSQEAIDIGISEEESQYTLHLL